MDLEFDKEMDALLRRAAGRGVLVGDSPKTHLDADTIAAFAENTLPEKSRMIYMQHLASCDPCRRTLAGLITLNAEAEPATAAEAAPIASQIPVPWYRKLFMAPNLAYVMGGLVLVFSGLFGFIVLQNSYQNSSATLSKVADTEPAQSAPARAEGTNSLSFPANANSATKAPGEIPRSVGAADDQIFADANTTGNTATAAPPPPVVAANSATLQAKDMSLDGLDKAKAPAGQPQPVNAPKREEDERAKNEVKLAAAAEQNARKQDATGNVFQNQQNQMTPGTGNRTAGPSRSDNQRDNRALESRQLDDKELLKARKSEKPAAALASGDSNTASVKRAGGKTFELKQGAWYDTAFSGQGTKNVRRASAEYQKLDGGLRSITDAIGGTVVVVWNGKAYRIQ